jgi:hypothetical protein
VPFIDLNESPGGLTPVPVPSTARVWLGAAHPDFASGHNVGALATGLVVNTAGVPSTPGRGTNGHVLTMVGGVEAWAAPAATGAPVGAQYITLALDASLTSERVLAVTSGHLTLSDGGAGGNATLGLPSVGPGAGAIGSSASAVTSVTLDAQGRVTASTAVAGTASQVLRIFGGVTSWGLIENGNISASASIDVTKLGNLAAHSVLGRAGAGIGAMAPITASTTGHALRFDGTTVGFGTLASGAFAGTATDGFVVTLVAGAPTWQAPSGGGTIDGSGAANRLAFWSDADTLTSSAALTFASNALSLSAASGGGAVTALIDNSSNTASSTARHTVSVGGASAGNPSARLAISGVINWDCQINNATSDRLEWTNGTDIPLYFDASGGGARFSAGNAPADVRARFFVRTVSDDWAEFLNTSSTEGSLVRIRNNSASDLNLWSFGSGRAGTFGGLTAAGLKAILAQSHFTVGTQSSDQFSLCTGNTLRQVFETNGNIGFHAAGSYAGGVKVIFIGNATTATSSAPTAGGVFEVVAGALYWRGSDNTLTFLAPA